MKIETYNSREEALNRIKELEAEGDYFKCFEDMIQQTYKIEIFTELKDIRGGKE